MNIQFADRMSDYKEGIFQLLDEKKEERLKGGKKVYNLSVGTPDFAPAPHIMEALLESAKKPENYRYSLKDRDELIKGVQYRFEKRYHVNLDPDEITSVYGTQEGMAHIAFTLCNPKDIVLVPDPGYPVFSIGPSLAGVEIVTYPLREENNYLPRLEDIQEDVLKRAKMMIVSYPLNPVCAAAPREFYEELVAFAKEKEIIIVHDNAYSDILYDNREGISLLSIDGAKEVGVEFYSLSKSFNLTGARISFLVGNAQIVSALKRLRSQIDYGIFTPIQKAAVAALTGPDQWVREQCREYERRRDTLCKGFRNIGWNVPDSQGTMFVWAPIPKGFDSSVHFVMELLDRTGVLCTPGSSFGALGEGYVRFALVLDIPLLEELIQEVKESGILG